MIDTGAGIQASQEGSPAGGAHLLEAHLLEAHLLEGLACWRGSPAGGARLLEGWDFNQLVGGMWGAHVGPYGGEEHTSRVGGSCKYDWLRSSNNPTPRRQDAFLWPKPQNISNPLHFSNCSN